MIGFLNLNFNEQSFINVHRYQSFEEAITEIIRLDSSDEEYMQKMENAWLDKSPTKFFWEEQLKVFLANIFYQPIELASRKCSFGFVKFEKEERIFQAELLKKRRNKNYYKNLILKNLNRIRVK